MKTNDSQFLILSEWILSRAKIGALISTIFTVFGASILILYMTQIGYVPDIGITDLTVLFIASAALGLFLVFILFIYPLMIAWTWRVALAVKSVKTYLENNDAQKKRNFLLLWFLVPVLLFVGIILEWVFPNQYFPATKYHRIIAYVAVALFVTLCLHFIHKIKMFDAIKYTLTLAFSSCAIIVAFYIWMSAAGDSISNVKNDVEFKNIISIVLLVMFIALSTINVYEKFKVSQSDLINKVIWHCLMAAIASFLFILFIGGPLRFTTIIVSKLGVGGLQNTKVVIDVTGLDSIDIFDHKCPENQRFCTIDNVDILWGRGERYLLRVKKEEDNPSANSSTNKTQQDYTIIIPEKLIVLIERRVTKKIK